MYVDRTGHIRYRRISGSWDPPRAAPRNSGTERSRLSMQAHRLQVDSDCLCGHFIGGTCTVMGAHTGLELLTERAYP